MLEKNVIVGEGGTYPLKGIVTLPEGCSEEEKVPAVVLIHGSGSSDMNEKVGKLTPFKDLAEGLAAHGIASLRYDKRSFAYPRQMLKEKNITVVNETIEDAVLAANLLKEEPCVDPGKVFVIGHSMGAMLAPRIDAEGGDFAGMVLMSGTPRTLAEVMMGQIWEMAEQKTGWGGKRARKQAESLEKVFNAMPTMTAEEAWRVKTGGGTTLYYFKEMAEHPAGDYLLATEKPVLVMQGASDAQVSVEKDFNAYKELMKDRANVTYRLYEGLNHAYVPALSEDIQLDIEEYNTERHIGDEVIGDIAAWIKEQSR